MGSKPTTANAAGAEGAEGVEGFEGLGVDGKKPEASGEKEEKKYDSNIEIEESEGKKKKSKKREVEFKISEDGNKGVRYPTFMKGYVYEPTEVPKRESDKPQVKLELEFIYGSSTKGVNGDFLFVNKDKKLVYPAAACGVVLDVETNEQRIFQGHEDDVKAITMHPNQDYVATGECGKDDFVHVWSSLTMEKVASIRTWEHFEHGGVLALAFSPCGKFLAMVGGNPFDSKIAVYEWADSKLIHVDGCSTKKTYSLRFNPYVENQIVWTGKDEILLFTMDPNGGKIKNNRAKNVSKKGKLQSFLCSFFDPQGNIYIGCYNGYVYVLDKEGAFAYKKKIHGSRVPDVVENESGFISVSRDKNIKVFSFLKEEDWTEDEKYFKMEKEVKLGYYAQRVCFEPEKYGSVGFTWGDENGIIEKIDLMQEDLARSVIMRSHSGRSAKDELWGVASFGGSEFVSAGDDGRIIIWDSATRKSVQVEKKSYWDFRAAGVSPDGKYFCVASKKGNVLLYETEKFKAHAENPDEDLEHSQKLGCGSEEISCIQFSPDGKYLAIGSHSDKIYVYGYRESKGQWKGLGSLRGHTSYVTALDFCKHSKYIQSTSGDYELLYWDVRDMERCLYPTKMKDVEWATQTCLLGWSIRGIWNLAGAQNDGTDVNSVCVDFDKKTIFSLDDFGKVNVFAYPTINDRPEPESYIGHCSHVTRCALSGDGKYLFSAGGGDLTIFQWKIVSK